MGDEQRLKSENEFLRYMIASLKDVKEGRIKDIKCLEKTSKS